MKKSRKKNEARATSAELPPNVVFDEHGQAFGHVAAREAPIPLAGAIVDEQAAPIGEISANFRNSRKLENPAGGVAPRSFPKAQGLDAPESEPQTDNVISENEAFGRLYANWLSARALFFSDSTVDENYSARAAANDCAERALLTTPAPSPCYVWQKWQVFEVLLMEQTLENDFADNRLISFLGSIKADCVRFLHA